MARSCSLLHVPVDLDVERRMDGEVRGWMAFAKQKLAELAILKRSVNEGRNSVAAELAASDTVIASRKHSPRTHDPQVRARIAAVPAPALERQSLFRQRRELQTAIFDLPPFPTTTIGSFPQTPEIRAARAAHKAGALDKAEYTHAMRRDIEAVVRFQERIGLDIDREKDQCDGHQISSVCRRVGLWQ